MNAQRKVILYIAVSLDGYIAGPGDDLSFLSAVEQEGEDYGYGRFIKTVDTVIMGRKTFEWVTRETGRFPHPDKETYIITHEPRPDEGRLHFYSGSLQHLISRLSKEPGQHLFIDGGAEIVHQLLVSKLIDEFYIAVIPVLLGDGTRLFQDGRPGQELEFAGSKTYPSGLVHLHYRSIPGN